MLERDGHFHAETRTPASPPPVATATGLAGPGLRRGLPGDAWGAGKHALIKVSQ